MDRGARLPAIHRDVMQKNDEVHRRGGRRWTVVGAASRTGRTRSRPTRLARPVGGAGLRPRGSEAIDDFAAIFRIPDDPVEIEPDVTVVVRIGRSSVAVRLAS